MALLLPVLTDIALWSGTEFAPGGVGPGLLLAVVPALLFFGVGSWRTSARSSVIVTLLMLVAARAVFEPTPTVIASGLLLVVAFALALRGRRVFAPMVIVALLGVLTKLPSRIDAAIAGARKIVARTRVANVSLLPVVVPAALVSVFVAVFALGNPVMAHGLGVVYDAVTKVVMRTQARSG